MSSDAMNTITYHAKLRGYKVFSIWLDNKKLTDKEIDQLVLPVTVNVHSETMPPEQFQLTITSTETYRNRKEESV